jgi:hypothetical protein
VDLPGQFSYYNAQLITIHKYQLRTGKEIRFRFGSSEDKAGKEAQHQKRNAQRSAFLVLG